MTLIQINPQSFRRWIGGERPIGRAPR